MELTKEVEAFLGGNAGVQITNEHDFEVMKSWMSIRNMFMENGDPVSKMKFKEGLNIIYRNEVSSISYVSYEQFPLQKILTLKDIGLVIDAETTVVEEVGVASIPVLQVGAYVAPPIDWNFEEFKLNLEQYLRKYKGLVVTNENYQEIKKDRANLNKLAKTINDQKIKLKKAMSQEVTEVENKMKSLIAMIDELIAPLDGSIKEIEAQKQNEKRQEIQKTIDEMKEMIVSNGMLEKRFADQFVFNEEWLKSNVSTKKINESINAQFNELIANQEQELDHIEAIKATFNEACRINHVEDHQLAANTYIEMFKLGTSLPDVFKAINRDVENIANIIKNETAKEVEKAKQSMPKIVDSNPQAISQGEDEKDKTIAVKIQDYSMVNPKTGEVVQMDPTKNYSYTYTFSGDFAAIRTFNMFLKALSKIMPSFKYEKIN